MPMVVPISSSTCAHAHPLSPTHTYTHVTTHDVFITQEMLTSWFGEVPFEEIREGNVADLITYGFWYKSQ